MPHASANIVKQLSSLTGTAMSKHSRSEPSLSIVGSRPSSVASARPPSGRKHNYRKVAETAQVDELLFGSPNPANTKNYSEWKDSDSPFGKQRPGLWSPDASRIADDISSDSPSHRSSTPSRSGTPLKGMPQTRHKYKLVKHTPTYVDEMLFGPRLPDPSFPAPWEKGEDGNKKQPFIWAPTCTSMGIHERSGTPTSGRPESSRSASRLGTPGRPGSRSGTRPDSAAGDTINRPLWK